MRGVGRSPTHWPQSLHMTLSHPGSASSSVTCRCDLLQLHREDLGARLDPGRSGSDFRAIGSSSVSGGDRRRYLAAKRVIRWVVAILGGSQARQRQIPVTVCHSSKDAHLGQGGGQSISESASKLFSGLFWARPKPKPLDLPAFVEVSVIVGASSVLESAARTAALCPAQSMRQRRSRYRSFDDQLLAFDGHN